MASPTVKSFITPEFKVSVGLGSEQYKMRTPRQDYNMDPFKEKTVEILRVMALTGNERALDELLLRKDNEKDDAVAQASAIYRFPMP
eukprot:gene13460-19320_t